MPPIELKSGLVRPKIVKPPPSNVAGLIASSSRSPGVPKSSTIPEKVLDIYVGESASSTSDKSRSFLKT